MADSTTVTSTTSSSGKTRISGLYSSIDVDGMVKASLTNEQNKIDSANKKLQKAQWKKEAYENVNTLVKDFQNTYLSYTSSKSIWSASYLKTNKVSLSQSTSAVTVAASSSATVNKFTITNTRQASYAKINSGTFNADFSKVGKNDAGEEVKIGTATISQLAQATGTKLNTITKDNKEYIQLNINGHDVDISADSTISDMMSTINNFTYKVKDSDGKEEEKSLGVKVTFNEFTNKFSFQSTELSTSLDIKAGTAYGTQGGGDGLFFNYSKEVDGNTVSEDKGLFGSTAKSAKGLESSITIVDEDGISKTYTKNDKELSGNVLSVGGYTITITGDYSASGADSGIGVTMQTDTDAMVDKITDFVNAYNDLVKSLTKMVTEKPNSKYDPLTDAEKEKASESEIAKLEAEAKKGILYGDSNIRGLLTNLRSAMNTVESTAGTSLRDIGISTGNYFTTDVQGTLEIDKDKLRSAIENNASDVVDLFTKASSAASSTSTTTKTPDEVNKSGGLASVFKTYSSNFIKNNTNNTISNWTKKISNYEDKLESLKDLFADREDALYTQFSQLEVLLSQMDASSAMFYSS